MHYSIDKKENWQNIKNRCFEGEVFIQPPSPASVRLISFLQDAFFKANNFAMHPQLHDESSVPQIMDALHKARALITPPSTSMPLIHNVINEMDDAPARGMHGDVLRLRSMPHMAHKQGLSPHSYSAHRDCWYANPQSQINIWIPIFDVTPGQSFAFFPKYFDTAIANSSANFDYDNWSKNVGFQKHTKKTDLSAYPVPTEDIIDPAGAAFEAVAGSRVIFSPSHLHQTSLNETGLSRFSVDFRVVETEDIASGAGAPNVDNASRGHAEQDYHPVARAHGQRPSHKPSPA